MNNTAWTKEELKRLREARSAGVHTKDLANLFPGRTSIACKDTAERKGYRRKSSEYAPLARWRKDGLSLKALHHAIEYAELAGTPIRTIGVKPKLLYHQCELTSAIEDDIARMSLREYADRIDTPYTTLQWRLKACQFEWAEVVPRGQRLLTEEQWREMLEETCVEQDEAPSGGATQAARYPLRRLGESAMIGLVVGATAIYIARRS